MDSNIISCLFLNLQLLDEKKLKEVDNLYKSFQTIDDANQL